MENLPLISIISIVYNGEKYLEQTILSVLNQSYKNIEYIIIDGGSSDNTLNIIKKYESYISKFISEKDEGVSDAFNKGLKLATGEVIGIINADDWYEDGALTAVIENIREEDVVYGDMRMWQNGIVEYVVKGSHDLLDYEMTLNHPTVFAKRHCYEIAGKFDSRYKCAMDFDLVLRFKLAGFKFRHVPQVLANMRWDGVSDTKWYDGCKETLEIKNKLMPDRKVMHFLYFYKHITAIALSKFLKRINLGFITKIYRANFSVLKKRYD
jgi:glycosyltransferase involved in cell wall biosynthesis